MSAYCINVIVSMIQVKEEDEDADRGSQSSSASASFIFLYYTHFLKIMIDFEMTKISLCLFLGVSSQSFEPRCSV